MNEYRDVEQGPVIRVGQQVPNDQSNWLRDAVRDLAREARRRGIAIDGELRALPRVGGPLDQLPTVGAARYAW